MMFYIQRFPGFEKNLAKNLSELEILSSLFYFRFLILDEHANRH